MPIPTLAFQRPRHGGHGGFTLIELLIVVSIISILSAIAVPNFLEAQTRSKVSRIRSDQRVLATALESYFADNNRYPPRAKFPLQANQRGIGIVETPFCQNGCRSGDMSVITTPIAYLTSLPVDVFENRIARPNDLIDYMDPILVEHLRVGQLTPGNQQGIAYEYARHITGKFGWALMSVGPDGVFGTPTNMGNYPTNTRTSATTWIHEYDPTNGTVSAGNLYRFQRAGAVGNEAFDPAWQ